MSDDTPSSVPVVLGRTPTHGVPIAVGVIPLRVLRDRARIPVSYQRAVPALRLRKLAREVSSGTVDLPGALVLSAPAFDADEHLVGSNGLTRLDVERLELHVLDGQESCGALVALLEDGDAVADQLELPFVCLLGPDEATEIEQFYSLHKAARRAPVDLAYDRLRAESSRMLVGSRRGWRAGAEALVERLEQSEPWRGLVRSPADGSAGTIISRQALGSSLRSPLCSPSFGAADPVDQGDILVAFWHGLREALPAPFTEPAAYVVQKATGAEILHVVLVAALERARVASLSPRDPHTYAQLLREPLERLRGSNRDGRSVSGAEFWRTGARGAAGGFSGSAGRRTVAAMIDAQLPPLDLG